MSIIVEKPYSKEQRPFKLIDFHKERNLFVKRPPYQRKNVWPTPKKEALIDSFFRRHYVPDIVLREVHTPDHLMKYEVVDGQQRINAVQEFFAEEFKLPKSLADITHETGKYYTTLDPEVKKHIEQQTLNATVLGGLTDPRKKKNQRLVADVFWRLQQGESLSYIEVEHSKLYSATRNFITKYADDLSFDYDKYMSRDYNPARHGFFKIIGLDNLRLQHLALLARFSMLESNKGSTDLGLPYLRRFIDDWKDKNLKDFEKRPEAKRCLKTLDILDKIFKEDPSVRKGGVIPELDREYTIVSIYLLASRLVNDGWNFGPAHYDKFREFVHKFYQRWQAQDDDDSEMLLFRDQRQQNHKAVEIRDQLITKWFFEYCPELDQLDPQRNFSYLQRIKIYRENKGICQACLAEGLSKEDATVPWNEFEADHLIPYSKGGKTTIENAQVLCRRHNRSLGNKK